MQEATMPPSKTRWPFGATLALCQAVLVSQAVAGDPPWIARGRAGMVASDSAEASRIGARILEEGGNAFDAAVATSFALGVTRPYSTGLGGGGFMVAYLAKEARFVVLDFRETAPAGASAEQYAKLRAMQGDGPPSSVYGGNAVGTPGLLAGLEEIRDRFGSMKLSDLVAPAIALAETGFEVDENYATACREALEDFEKWPLLRYYVAIGKELLRAGSPPTIGDRVRRPDLARAFAEIAASGPAAIYGGAIGQAMADAAQKAGGTLTLDDLKAYRVREREPIRAKFLGHEIVSMPPPSSGGVCIVETLNIMEHLPAALRRLPDAESRPVGAATQPADGSAQLAAEVRRRHLLIEALKHAFADRARWLGDADFADVPVGRLTDAEYAAGLAARIAPDGAGAPEAYGTRQLPDDGGTSHFCVADAQGNVVAITETINGTFGSLIMVEPYGIILNNEMDDFATAPGEENLYGLIQGEANAVAPGKRSLSSMSPTIVMKDGKPVLVLGASGGPRIITSVLQVLLDVVRDDLPLEQALSATRLHHQWMPDEVYFDGATPAWAKGLEALGHNISDQRRGAVVQAIRFLPDGVMVGASDPRKGGRPAAATEKSKRP
jgi:gamma-glutamyltranspeptidase/glutathione hydrolase